MFSFAKPANYRYLRIDTYGKSFTFILDIRTFVTIFDGLVEGVREVLNEIATQYTCFRIHESGTRMQRNN